MIQQCYTMPAGVQWGWKAPENDDEIDDSVKGVVLPVQVHSCNVAIVGRRDEPVGDTDALITRERGLRIGVRTADCVPVVIFAPDIMAVAAVHAGWKGTYGRIVSVTVRRLADMGADPSMMYAAVGAAVCGECYEVGEDVASLFLEDPLLARSMRLGGESDPLGRCGFAHGKPRIDLPVANQLVLLREGVPLDNISMTGVCTRHTAFDSKDATVSLSPRLACDDTEISFLPSWRREPGTVRRIVTWISLPII